MAGMVGETVKGLHAALQEYIEAAYHIGHPTLVDARRELLKTEGVIAGQPFFESTPRYQSHHEFASLQGVHPAVVTLFQGLSESGAGQAALLYDPPYSHQYEAIEEALGRERSLVVMTGTGSGKTESFLLPIMGKCLREAARNPTTFGTRPGIRAMVLYPMNALVNDQLARLRLLFGDARVVQAATRAGGRPIRFARYTSRTLYPGVRTREDDSRKLKPIERYYLKLSEGTAEERNLAEALKTRGKWPCKPDLRRWFGQSNQPWQRGGRFVRAVTLPEDTELFTRHEVQAGPPDVLVTNYSMLEYMLMRPLEREIFDATAAWLHDSPSEKFMLVVDEAHLYRGAAGAEVGYLVRRLRDRLRIPPERLQVICTSASFSRPELAAAFAAQLTGKEVGDFTVVQGKHRFRAPAAPGGVTEAQELAAIPIEAFYAGVGEQERREVIQAFLQARGALGTDPVEQALYEALKDDPQLNLLVNASMGRAWPLRELEEHVFPGVNEEMRSRAVANLMALGCYARPDADKPGLLPCRVHAFFRRLPGLWVCTDPDCSALPETQRGGPAGKLTPQPRERCECGAVVLELYTCRNCGTAYARGYTDSVERPTLLWGTPGERVRVETGWTQELRPLDILLEAPGSPDAVEPADLDLVSGRINPHDLGPRTRTVYLKHDRVPRQNDNGQVDEGGAGLFVPCGVCGRSGVGGATTVQDHVTKGEEPFQALIAAQLAQQPPGEAAATSFAPNRGRKVLIFSDSRQMAAKLAPNIQAAATRDLMRPLLVRGFSLLRRHEKVARRLSLADSYAALGLGAATLGVVLQAELRDNESLRPFAMAKTLIERGGVDDAEQVEDYRNDVQNEKIPYSLLAQLQEVITHRYYGLVPLALGSLVERVSDHALLQGLAAITPGYETFEEKRGLVRFWLNEFALKGVWFPHSPAAWLQTKVEASRGNFESLGRILDAQRRREFERHWLPRLRETYLEPAGAETGRLLATRVSFAPLGDWTYCQFCRTVKSLMPGVTVCAGCGRQGVSQVDPDTDPVFVARKGYFRRTTLQALREPPVPPLGIVAAEHTAQIGEVQDGDIYSAAEEHELLFQDVPIQSDRGGIARPAIDVLSCTTTMEVGIDIGALSGVALRNMPPGRANYQQRAGRAGRRGKAIATVIAYAGADTHDNHFFANPKEIISGAPRDPTLALDNIEIARRHVLAFLVQAYLQARVTGDDAENSKLFEVLGTVEDFLGREATINRGDFAAWLGQATVSLEQRLRAWLPKELAEESTASLVAELAIWPVRKIDEALLVSAQAGATQ